VLVLSDAMVSTLCLRHVMTVVLVTREWLLMEKQYNNLQYLQQVTGVTTQVPVRSSFPFDILCSPLGSQLLMPSHSTSKNARYITIHHDKKPVQARQPHNL
jgi:hypothetical protein